MNAITKSQDYDAGLLPLVQSDLSPEEIFFELAMEDIQEAADLFLPLYQESKGGDGYVSLEVSPFLASDTATTLDQAMQLWRHINRPNLMIKIPGTRAGLPAISDALAAGLNVNVTLIFARQRYNEVMDAYLKGLERRIEAGLPVEAITSVASFFVSRHDTKADQQLQEIIKSGDGRAPLASALLGTTGIATARLAYADFRRFFSAERFQKLEARGARVQRPLWASTSTKNPAYSDVVYVEELVGPDTVNSMPPHTLAAFLDHGKVRLSMEEDLEGARQVLDDLERLGIPVDQITLGLEEQGVALFSDAFARLLDALEARRPVE